MLVYTECGAEKIIRSSFEYLSYSRKTSKNELIFRIFNFIIFQIFLYNCIHFQWIDFFDIVAEFLQENTLSSFLFIISLDYVQRTSIDLMKENGFTLKKPKSRRYSAVTISDADYADDLALLASTPTEAESLLHCLDQAAKGIGLNVNSDKTEIIWFNQDGAISSLNEIISSYTSVAISHLLKAMLIYTPVKHGLLLTV